MIEEDTTSKNATDTNFSSSSQFVIDPIEKLSYTPVAQSCVAI